MEGGNSGDRTLMTMTFIIPNDDLSRRHCFMDVREKEEWQRFVATGEAFFVPIDQRYINIMFCCRVHRQAIRLFSSLCLPGTCACG